MEIKNRVYQLYELREEFKKAIANSQAVEDSERLLVKIIFETKYDQTFSEFIKSLTANWKQYEKQRANLNAKLEKINYLIQLHEEQNEVSDNAVSLVLEILGADAPEKENKA